MSLVMSMSYELSFEYELSYKYELSYVRGFIKQKMFVSYFIIYLCIFIINYNYIICMYYYV